MWGCGEGGEGREGRGAGSLQPVLISFLPPTLPPPLQPNPSHNSSPFHPTPLLPPFLSPLPSLFTPNHPFCPSPHLLQRLCSPGPCDCGCRKHTPDLDYSPPSNPPPSYAPNPLPPLSPRPPHLPCLPSPPLHRLCSPRPSDCGCGQPTTGLNSSLYPPSLFAPCPPPSPLLPSTFHPTPSPPHPIPRLCRPRPRDCGCGQQGWRRQRRAV